MEQLAQKYIKYFYMILLVSMFVQLFGVTTTILTSNWYHEGLAAMVLFLVNIILLIDAIKHNSHQQFTECKEDARVLRFTVGLLGIIRIVACFKGAISWIILADYIVMVSIIEVVLEHRIKSIEHLERLAKKVTH